MHVESLGGVTRSDKVEWVQRISSLVMGYERGKVFVLCSLSVLGIFHQFFSKTESALEFKRLNNDAM